MAFRLVRTSRVGIEATKRFQRAPRQYIRCMTSGENKVENKEESQVQKKLAATRAYLDKVQGDMKPRFEPYIEKIQHASEQLKKLTMDVSDSKEALKRASKVLNELTGYDQIDHVKRKVNNQGKKKKKNMDIKVKEKLKYMD